MFSQLNKATIFMCMILTVGCTSPNERNVSISEPTDSRENGFKQVELFSKYEEGFEITNLANSQDLVNYKNTNAFFDFDSEQVVNNEAADIYLSVSCGTNCYNSLIGINETKSVRMKNDEPGLSGCLKSLSAKELNSIALSIGRYSCLLTNEHKIVEIFIVDNKVFGSNEGSVLIKFRIWEGDNNK